MNDFRFSPCPSPKDGKSKLTNSINHITPHSLEDLSTQMLNNSSYHVVVDTKPPGVKEVIM